MECSVSFGNIFKSNLRVWVEYREFHVYILFGIRPVIKIVKSLDHAHTTEVAE